ncbi:MAG: SCO family protein [Bacteroidota bacterium]
MALDRRIGFVFFIGVGILVVLSACQSGSKILPILGQKKIVDGDTVFHQIPDFTFINQDSLPVTQELVEGKIYVTDFFFTSCPSICPKMSQQMLRIQERFKEEAEVLLLSHSIDPTYDTPEVLSGYAEKLEIDTKKWHLLTGNWKDIYNISDEYLAVVAKDSTAPGGYLHSGHFLLVDGNRRIRGAYDGTQAKQVDRLMNDMDVLLEEMLAEGGAP